jgi:hypothetical protein
VEIETVGSSFHFGFHFFPGKSFSHQYQYVFDALGDLPQNAVVVEKLTVQVAELAENRSGAQLLMTHSGVGPVTALATDVFLGDPQRFVDGKSLASFTQPENRGAVVCRALTNRTETPFLAQLLSLKSSGPPETPLQAFLIVG